MAVAENASASSRRALKDIATFVMGQSPPSATYNTEGRGLPFLQGKAEFGDVRPAHMKWCSSPLKVAPAGAVLVSVRAPVGDVNLAQMDYCIGRGLAAVVCNEGYDPEFVFYSLLHGKSRLEAQGTGTTFQSINKGILENFTIWAPPYAEQKAIANVINAAHQAKEAADKVIAATRELKRSLMRHLFTYGPVSVEKAEQVELQETEIGWLPRGWKVERLGNLAELIQYGTSERATGSVTGVPVLGIPQVVRGKVELLNLRYLPRDTRGLSKLMLANDDLLFVRTNATRANIGRCAVYHGQPEEAAFASI
jgi:type I restriction enzyme, S subunit